MLNSLRPVSSPTDHLFVGTDNFMYFTLAWDSSIRQLVTQKSYVDIGERTARESQTGDRCHIDPSGRFMTLETFEGIVTVIPILQTGEPGALGEPMSSRISELFVKSSCFLRGGGRGAKDKPKFAVIYEDSQSKVRLKVSQLAYTPGKGNQDGGVEFESIENGDFPLDYGASHLIPVPEPWGGAIILSEQSITYYDEGHHDIDAKPLQDATIWCAWAQIDDQRFVLADDYGRLYLFMLLFDVNGEVDKWKLEMIGETSRASTLVYLDAGLVFVGSHQGDSQVIRITEGSMEVIQTFSNVAPILDFTIMDMGNRSGEGQSNEFSSGQARIVAGSGAWKDGSLRSVRSGVGLEDLGTLGEMDNITEVFGISSGRTEEVDTLVVSFINETRVFRFSEDGEVEEAANFGGLSLDKQTLYAASLPQGQLLQVTGSSATITDAEGGMSVAAWSSSGDQPITAVSYAKESLLLSIGGAEIVLLDVGNGLREQARKSFAKEGQIACIALSSAAPPIALVGFWHDALVSILDARNLEPIHTLTAVEDGALSVPRSLLLTNIFPSPAPPTLFIAMADGNVVTYSIDLKTYQLSSRKSIVLGTQQATFKALPRGDGIDSVFAICDHPSLIYASEGRIVYSAVTAERATCVAPFDAATCGYPDAIAIATPDDLRIALIDKERTTHVQTLGINETVRRIAYSPALKAFGMGTIKRVLVDGAEVVESHFRLADEVLFKKLDDFPLNRDELVESVIRAELDDGAGGLIERFVVGTAYLEQPGEGDSVKGRILILEVSEEERKINLVLEISVKGACRCLAMSHGRIVAGLIKSVAIYDFQQRPGQSPKLEKKASYRTSTAPVDITVTGRGDIIAVADLMKSVSLLRHEVSQPGVAGQDILKEVARHYQSVWGTTVAEVDEHQYLETDGDGNLLLMRRDVDGVTDEDRRRLKVEAEMCLGEMVNRVRRIDVATQDAAVVQPRAFLGTVSHSTEFNIDSANSSARSRDRCTSSPSSLPPTSISSSKCNTCLPIW